MSDSDSFDYMVVMDRATEIYGGEFDQEIVIAHLAALEDRLIRSSVLQQLAKDYTLEEFAIHLKFKSELLNAIISMVSKQRDISTRGINSLEIRDGLARILIDYCGLYSALNRQN